jgi:hypothetical protein
MKRSRTLIVSTVYLTSEADWRLSSSTHDFRTVPVIGNEKRIPARTIARVFKPRDGGDESWPQAVNPD